MRRGPARAYAPHTPTSLLLLHAFTLLSHSLPAAPAVTPYCGLADPSSGEGCAFPYLHQGGWVDGCINDYCALATDASGKVVRWGKCAPCLRVPDVDSTCAAIGCAAIVDGANCADAAATLLVLSEPPPLLTVQDYHPSMPRGCFYAVQPVQRTSISTAPNVYINKYATEGAASALVKPICDCYVDPDTDSGAVNTTAAPLVRAPVPTAVEVTPVPDVGGSESGEGLESPVDPEGPAEDDEDGGWLGAPVWVWLVGGGSVFLLVGSILFGLYYNHLRAARRRRRRRGRGGSRKSVGDVEKDPSEAAPLERRRTSRESEVVVLSSSKGSGGRNSNSNTDSHSHPPPPPPEVEQSFEVLAGPSQSITSGGSLRVSRPGGAGRGAATGAGNGDDLSTPLLDRNICDYARGLNPSLGMEVESVDGEDDAASTTGYRTSNAVDSPMSASATPKGVKDDGRDGAYASNPIAVPSSPGSAHASPRGGGVALNGSGFRVSHGRGRSQSQRCRARNAAASAPRRERHEVSQALPPGPYVGSWSNVTEVIERNREAYQASTTLTPSSSMRRTPRAATVPVSAGDGADGEHESARTEAAAGSGMPTREEFKDLIKESIQEVMKEQLQGMLAEHLYGGSPLPSPTPTPGAPPAPRGHRRRSSSGASKAPTANDPGAGGAHPLHVAPSALGDAAPARRHRPPPRIGSLSAGAPPSGTAREGTPPPGVMARGVHTRRTSSVANTTPPHPRRGSTPVVHAKV